MTGWGQDGPLAPTAGHDIDYIAVAGVLAHIGRPDDRPPPPLNLIADFGGGGMLLAFGVLCALHERHSSGKGQVVDAAMVDGAALLMAMMWGMRSIGRFHEDRGTNINDGAAPFYDTYQTRDGKYVAVGAMEPKFYAELLERLGIVDDVPRQHDRATWSQMHERIGAVFMQRTRDEWCAELEASDSCVAPVLRMSEAVDHPHMRARGTIVEHDGQLQPAPAPRLSRTPGALGRPMPLPGADTESALLDWGFPADEIQSLRASGALHQRTAGASSR
jgi:alpha-methylacyl-CoA racemase